MNVTTALVTRYFFVISCLETVNLLLFATLIFNFVPVSHIMLIFYKILYHLLTTDMGRVYNRGNLVVLEYRFE